MSSNQKQMTLEERIVQTLKDDTLMKLVGDEDAITELVKRAITEALFQPQRRVDTYGRVESTDSIVVSQARAFSQKLVDDMIRKICTELEQDERVRKAIIDAIVAHLPSAIESRASNLVYASNESAKLDAVRAVQEAIRNRMIVIG